MKTDKKNLIFSKEVITVVMPVLFVIILIIPISGLFLDIFMAVNLLFALAIFLSALCIRKTTDFTLYPVMILLSLIFDLAVNISAIRLILTKGDAFDGKLIKFVSSLLSVSGNIGLIILFVVFIVIFAIQTLITIKIAVRVFKIYARFTLDTMEIKMLAIETEYASGSISEDEAEARKCDIQNESDSYGSLNGACEFLSEYEKMKFFILVSFIIGGILFGIYFGGETINDAVRTYISLSIGYGIFLVIHGFMLSFAVKTIISRMVEIKKDID
jgi:flagellar biosynthesis protein FlhA